MSYYDEVKTADSLIEELRARIAELEAENALLLKCRSDDARFAERAVEQAEAALAALNAQRCETCRHYATNDYGYYCESADTPWFEEQPPPNYSCIYWAERITP